MNSGGETRGLDSISLGWKSLNTCHVPGIGLGAYRHYLR